MRALLILFFILSTNLLLGDEFSRSHYQINKHYKAGAFLIYDCEGLYFSCVDADSNEACKSKREFAMANANNTKDQSYPCAPLRKFSEQADCQRKNYAVVEANAKRRFCYPKIR